RIHHVHCKDVRAPLMVDLKNRDASFLRAVLSGVFAMPGDGMVDYPALCNALARDGYAGWLVVEAEQDPAVAPSYPEAVKGYTHLKACCDKAGLKVA
ncbi:MAG: TIM barrel protein, partial [Rickettsiales bacterium]